MWSTTLALFVATASAQQPLIPPADTGYYESLDCVNLPYAPVTLTASVTDDFTATATPGSLPSALYAAAAAGTLQVDVGYDLDMYARGGADAAHRTTLKVYVDGVQTAFQGPGGGTVMRLRRIRTYAGEDGLHWGEQVGTHITLPVLTADQVDGLFVRQIGAVSLDCNGELHSWTDTLSDYDPWTPAFVY